MLSNLYDDDYNLYALSKNGKIDKKLTGVTQYSIKGDNITAIFDSSKHGDNPDAEHLTLQHPMARRILDEIDGNTQSTCYYLERRE